MSWIREKLSFGFEQTFTIEEWWTEPGFTSTSDTPLKREKMLQLAIAIAQELSGRYIESKDIWGHLQYETFDAKGLASFVVTMDPGSIEVKTPPVLVKDLEKMAVPLFVAANKVGLVTYRNWWYGVQGATEGGCHVNMAGLGPSSNPLANEPLLAIKYCAYLHNRPWLTYPFMGPDVGPGGNAQRMDEYSDFAKTQKTFDDFSKAVGKNWSLDEVIDYFADTTLVKEKSSAPSLYKFKKPDYFIEDRAQESLRSPEDFKLVSELRLNILENICDMKIETLEVFPKLHREILTSFWLWEKFQNWANEIGINPVFYQRFFDRQFPELRQGSNIPLHFGIKEGRRPRVITNIQKRGEVVISKTIDTSYKRFELFYHTETNEDLLFEVEAEGIEHLSDIFEHKGHLSFGPLGKAYYCYFDIKFNSQNPKAKIKLNDKHGKTKEIVTFDINNMMWD